MSFPFRPAVLAFAAASLAFSAAASAQTVPHSPSPASPAAEGSTVRDPDSLTLASPSAPDWGLAFAFRYSNVPYAAEKDAVAELVPLFFYEGERLYLRGLEGGYRLWFPEEARPAPGWGLDAVARYRFYDIPRERQNADRRDALDVGLRLVRPLSDGWRGEIDLLSDTDARTHAIARLTGDFASGPWHLVPALELRVKSSAFNSRYYGFDERDVDAGADVRARLRFRRHLVSNLHLVGAAELGLLDSAARRSAFVEDDWEWEGMLGLGIFAPPPKLETTAAPAGPLARPYVRFAQGWGSDARLGEILVGQNRSDGVPVYMSSLFYGHPLSDTLFGLPIEVYLSPGVAHHYASSVQGAATEYVLKVKFFHTLELPVIGRLRLGAAEGLSYMDSITFYEERDLRRKGYDESRLLNHLDFSAELNLGDLFRSRRLADLWLGASIHHRSGIFETTSLFGRIKGGANFNTITLTWML
jgi:outer membrane protein